MDYLNIEQFMAYRPLIGITMRVEVATRRFYLGRDYSEALVGAGARPVHIPLVPDRDYISGLLGGLDGVLLPGSDTDVDPLRFGQHPHPRLGTVVPEKDETDLLVLEEAEARNLPVFAICYGMQVLNVHRGGTLHQDINSELPSAIKHEQGIPLERRSHTLNVEQGSLVENALGVGTTTVNVNSHHHQAIAKIGNDLRATAFAVDGVVEAIEDTREDRFTIGTQWHPELDWRNDPLSRGLFQKFVRRAAELKNCGDR